MTPEKNRGGRPRTGTPVLIRIPADLLARIDQMAADALMTRAELIRHLLAHAMDESGAPPS
jgi:metal-responsive CopG/Arc/MetJ family transcriptional regulator